MKPSKKGSKISLHIESDLASKILHGDAPGVSSHDKAVSPDHMEVKRSAEDASSIIPLSERLIRPIPTPMPNPAFPPTSLPNFAPSPSNPLRSIPLPMNLMPDTPRSAFEKMHAFVNNFSPVLVLKGLVLVVVVVFVLSIVASSLNVARSKGPGFFASGFTSDSSVSSTGVSYPATEARYMGNAGKGGGGGLAMGAPSLSTRNVMSDSSAMPISYPIGTTGDTAEDFEVTDFTAYVESEELDTSCAAITELKALTYVIFESASESDHYCGYTFKVEHAHVAEVLAKIQSLDPKSLSENTYTIKRQLDDFTSQTEILEKKRQSIEDTLESAIAAYDEVTALAMKTKDAESLAEVINSKVGIIERLTQEQININQQLEYLLRAKQDQLDRILYTYFNVTVAEKIVFNEELLVDSWYGAVQDFVEEANDALQNATIHMVTFMLHLGIALLYLFILLVVAKFSWKTAKHIWKK